MARALSSWLSGPEPADSTQQSFPGERLGLPERGSGSIARFGRRIAAMVVDWLIAVGLTWLAVPFGLFSRDEMMYSLDSRNIILLVWFLIGVGSVRLFGFTPGQFAVGLVVIPVDGAAHVGLGRALGRNLLIMLVIPALFTDADHRGLHDLASKTAVVRR